MVARKIPVLVVSGSIPLSFNDSWERCFSLRRGGPVPQATCAMFLPLARSSEDWRSGSAQDSSPCGQRFDPVTLHLPRGGHRTKSKLRQVLGSNPNSSSAAAPARLPGGGGGLGNGRVAQGQSGRLA